MDDKNPLVAQHRKAEEALHEDKRSLARAMSLAQLVDWEYDVARGLFTFSDLYYTLRGTTSEQEGGDAMSTEDFVRKFVHPDDAHLVDEEIGRAVATVDPHYLSQLELRVFRRDGELRHVLLHISAVKDAEGRTVWLHGTSQDITEGKRLHRQLLEISRMANMAEVATSVLHNVGNVLNSVNVSSSIISDKVRRSKIANLGKAVDLLQQHEQDLAAFLTQDDKGKQVLGYLHALADHLASEQAEVVKELALLTKNVDHIKEIVAMQQSYSKISGICEIVPPSDLVEDALRMNRAALDRRQIVLVREYSQTPAILVEKHKVLQILVNLVCNARHACDESGRPDKQLTVRVKLNDHNQVDISVIDNGIGIPDGNLARIFSHGFTTRRDGHGFGLHSGALAAKELGGTLTVRSDGVGRGAVFTLELPLQPPGVTSANLAATAAVLQMDKAILPRTME
jgi:signal transduction histidine kinase